MKKALMLLSFFVLNATSAYAEVVEGVVKSFYAARNASSMEVTLDTGAKFTLMTVNDLIDNKMIMVVQTAFITGSKLQAEVRGGYAYELTLTKD